LSSNLYTFIAQLKHPPSTLTLRPIIIIAAQKQINSLLTLFGTGRMTTDKMQWHAADDIRGR
jgi:hypothetical protein